MLFISTVEREGASLWLRHVIPYLLVYSVPSWGPYAGCRHTVQVSLSSLLQCVLTVGQFLLLKYVFIFHY